jgi:hypothetical protein
LLPLKQTVNCLGFRVSTEITSENYFAVGKTNFELFGFQTVYRNSMIITLVLTNHKLNGFILRACTEMVW